MDEQDGGGVVPIVPVGVHLHGVAPHERRAHRRARESSGQSDATTEAPRRRWIHGRGIAVSWLATEGVRRGL